MISTSVFLRRAAQQGNSAIEIGVSPQTLVFDTDNNGVVVGLADKYATVRVVRDGLPITSSVMTIGSTTNCSATLSQNGGSATVRITAIASETVYDSNTKKNITMSKTAAAVVVNVAFSGTIYTATINVQVNVVKLIAYTQIEQGRISMKVDNVADNLAATGIDIENKKITVTSDNFLVKNNKGETSAAIDADGKLQAGSVETSNDKVSSSMKAGVFKVESKSTKAYITMGIDENEYPQLRFVNPDGTTQFFIGFNGLAYGFKTPKLLSVRSQYRTSLNTKINQYETNYTLTLGIKNVDETRSLDSGYFTAECQTLNDSNLVIYDTMEQSVETPIEPGATSFVVFTYLLLTAEQPTSLPLPPQYRVKFVGDMFTNGEFSV